MKISTIEKQLAAPPDAGLLLSEAMRVDRAYQFLPLDHYSLWERLQIRAAGFLFYLAATAIGRSARFEVKGLENLQVASRDGHVPIYALWHNSFFLAIYFWRKQGVIVMSSRSFDAEYTARCLQRLGYGLAKGSSTRGAIGGLIEMVRLMRAGCPTAFTIDGPRGPRFVAKMGAVLLAKKTGNPIVPYRVTAAKYWEANSWDRFQVAKPFTRALVDIAPPIYVAPVADKSMLEAKRAELQASLDELNRRGDQWRARIN